MSQATQGSLGAIRGLWSTLPNMGTPLRFVPTLTVAAAGVPRSVAYGVFLETTNLLGGLGPRFLADHDTALYGEAVVLVGAAALSWSRGSVGGGSRSDRKADGAPRFQGERNLLR
jgi:hypothetical protein